MKAQFQQVMDKICSLLIRLSLFTPEARQLNDFSSIGITVRIASFSFSIGKRRLIHVV